MSDELKPCPFCGQARARFTTEPSTDGVGKYMRLECIDCRSGTMPFHFYEDDPELRQHLRDRWNRRAQPAEEVQKDAERYRWLRDPMSGSTRHDPKVYKDGPQEDVEWAYGEELDAMVDEAKARDDAQRAKWKKKP